MSDFKNFEKLLALVNVTSVGLKASLNSSLATSLPEFVLEDSVSLHSREEGGNESHEDSLIGFNNLSDVEIS
jgi:hypothetical protein